MNNDILNLFKELKKLNARLYLNDGVLNLDIDPKLLSTDITNTIKENKQEIIDLLTARDRTVVQEIKVLEPQDAYALSSAQYRLWVQSQLGEGSSSYNMPAHLFLDGTYDVPNFKRAIWSVLERHEILRTVFRRNQAGELEQVVLDVSEIGFEIGYENYTKATNPQQCVEAYIQQDSFVPFDLEHGPLIRVCLLQSSDSEYTLYYNMHHIISDGWSMDILARDILAFYNCYTNGTTLELPELRIQYKDYAAWQLEQLKTEKYQSHQTYWLDKLSGSLPVLDLPSNKQRPASQTHNGQKLSVYLPKKDTQAVRTYIKDNGGTLFMFLLSSLKVLFYKYTGQEDIIVGSPVAGRDNIDLENQIGFYINTLIFRSQIDAQLSFDAFYKKEVQNLLEAYNHQSYPFNRLVEDLDLKRDTSRSTLFDVIVELQNTEEIPDTINSRIEAGIVKDEGKTMSKLDATFTFTEEGAHIGLTLTYNSDVYDREMMTRLLQHYQGLVHAIVAEKNTTIGRLDYLSNIERTKLLQDFNDTTTAYPKDKTVLDLFKARVTKHPEKTALVFEGNTLTYQELDHSSSQLAKDLRSNHSLASGDLVGIQLEHSDWLVVAILGILKTGAAFVPLSPELSSARKADIVKEANIKLLITESAYLFEIDYFEGDMMAIDLEFDPASCDHSSVQDTLVSAEGLAYVLYTSGSTGKPKGVMIEHSALANYLNWSLDNYVLANELEGDIGLFTSLSFDLTMTSLFLPLIGGYKLNVFPTRTDVAETLKAYLESDVSLIKMTPSHISLLGAMEVKNTNIDLAIVGGEALLPSQVELLKKINPSIKIYNEYGPTEATIGCIVYEVDAPDNKVLIGKPIANTEICILDVNEELAAIGVVGEIGISGAGLARGYCNRPDLTADKFVKHPYRKEQRMYKTGDLARWMPDGNIEFIGRIDDQVKIRGYRIELGDIEHALITKEEINNAVVVVKESNTGDKDLVAYYCSTVELKKSALRIYLESTLPTYMVPNYFVPLPELPLTTNGKVDKKALPNPDALEVRNEVAYVAPQSAVEQALVTIWESVLERDQIGVDDDFFNLGGHSIKAVTIASDIARTLNVNVNIADLFKDPNIRNLAVEIENRLSQDEVIEEDAIVDKVVI